MQMNPYLYFDGDCEAAFKFYEKVLGAKIVVTATWCVLMAVLSLVVVAAVGATTFARAQHAGIPWVISLVVAGLVAIPVKLYSATATAERVGRFSVKYSTHTSFTAANSPMSIRYSVVLTTSSRVAPS